MFFGMFEYFSCNCVCFLFFVSNEAGITTVLQIWCFNQRLSSLEVPTGWDPMEVLLIEKEPFKQTERKHIAAEYADKIAHLEPVQVRACLGFENPSAFQKTCQNLPSPQNENELPAKISGRNPA